jgi:polyphenol oxidase
LTLDRPDAHGATRMDFERRHLGGHARALVALDLERIGVLAAFTERGGGSSRGPFESLNVSFSVGDDPAAVRRNRRRITDGLRTAPFAVAGLVHGATIRRIGAAHAGSGFDDPAESVRFSDGLATTSRSVALGVTSADCVPIVFGSSSERTVVVVHAGWRGFAAGIVASAARLYRRPSDVRVAIGPAIGPDHYEVGRDVARAVASGSTAGAVVTERAGRPRLDLAATARVVLAAAGIERIVDTGLCTACEPDRFFSHRRDGATGRQLAVGVRT